MRPRKVTFTCYVSSTFECLPSCTCQYLPRSNSIHQSNSKLTLIINLDHLAKGFYFADKPRTSILLAKWLTRRCNAEKLGGRSI